MGKTYYVGNDKDDCVKLDIMYTDAFIHPAENIGFLRLATVEDIVAMKMQAIATGGRKKDWWDIHYLLNYYSLNQMLYLHREWQPWTHDEKDLLLKLTTFQKADSEPDPNCLLDEDWDTIKLDIISAVDSLT